MRDKVQFDKLLGGLYDLPRSVTVKDFIAARAPELAALNHAIETASRDKPLNTKYPPIHMRRKLMSHNRNQLPRRVLEAIKKRRKEKDSSSIKIKKISKSKNNKKKREKKNIITKK